MAENGPELYDEGGRTYLLSGGDGGHVTPLSRNAYRPSMPVTVNVHGVDSQPQVRARPDARGGLSIDLIFRQVKDRLAHDIDAGVGSLPRALERRYGLNRQLA
ncbi:putative phage tail protein [Bordetella pertussis]|nr:putative phage tail protein [Bordetella pertussis]